jgi:hypothetical protein
MLELLDRPSITTVDRSRSAGHQQGHRPNNLNKTSFHWISPLHATHRLVWLASWRLDSQGKGYGVSAGNYMYFQWFGDSEGKGLLGKIGQLQLAAIKFMCYDIFLCYYSAS